MGASSRQDSDGCSRQGVPCRAWPSADQASSAGRGPAQGFRAEAGETGLENQTTVAPPCAQDAQGGAAGVSGHLAFSSLPGSVCSRMGT